jgi:hypothetical protein
VCARARVFPLSSSLPRTPLRCDTNLHSSASYQFWHPRILIHFVVTLYFSFNPQRSACWFAFATSALLPSSSSTLEVNSIMAHRLINKRVSSVEHDSHFVVYSTPSPLPFPHLIIVCYSTLAATCFISNSLYPYLSATPQQFRIRHQPTRVPPLGSPSRRTS